MTDAVSAIYFIINVCEHKTKTKCQYVDKCKCQCLSEDAFAINTSTQNMNTYMMHNWRGFRTTASRHPLSIFSYENKKNAFFYNRNQCVAATDTSLPTNHKQIAFNTRPHGSVFSLQRSEENPAHKCSIHPASPARDNLSCTPPPLRHCPCLRHRHLLQGYTLRPLIFLPQTLTKVVQMTLPEIW